MIFHINKEFLRVNEELYEVLRKLREDSKLKIDVLKEYLGAEKVFRKDGYLFFCTLVPEAEIVKDEESVQIEKKRK